MKSVSSGRKRSDESSYVDLPGAENCCGVSSAGDHCFLHRVVNSFLSGCWRTSSAGKGHGLA